MNQHFFHKALWWNFVHFVHVSCFVYEWLGDISNRKVVGDEFVVLCCNTLLSHINLGWIFFFFFSKWGNSFPQSTNVRLCLAYGWSADSGLTSGEKFLLTNLWCCVFMQSCYMSIYNNQLFFLLLYGISDAMNYSVYKSLRRNKHNYHETDQGRGQAGSKHTILYWNTTAGLSKPFVPSFKVSY